MKTVLHAALTLALFGCSDANPVQPPAEPRVHLTQEILQMEVVTSLSCPPQNSVRILAGKGACDTPLDPIVTREGQTISIRLLVSTAPGACIARLDGYHVTVPLPSDLPPGTYTVTAVAESGSKSVSVGVADCG